MGRPKYDTDIRPVSEFRANAADLIEQLRGSGRPLILTQRGHSAAVVLDVAAYEQLLEEIELLRDVRNSEKQLATGKAVSNREAKAQLRKRFSR
ncbi:MAG TPA: type II toxin-antitoxin system Phd/YefM family antitoxin [Burkholderiales bacterium]|nr:type II toxin-antitoxin system Phd/YefM family antitoxin [Burkholderiales bacterium]